MRIAILTSPNQWFVPHAKNLAPEFKDSELFYNHKELQKPYDIVFILAYHKIIEPNYLKANKHNIVIHESDLPQGKGWAPLFWQIIEGKNEIVFSMFEASFGVDDGSIYMKKQLQLTGLELNQELREKQANLTLEMCKEFVNNYDMYKVAQPQKGKESFYKKRTPKDSEIDIHATIDEQFNLLRTVDNENYPAYFYKNGKKYLLHIMEA